MLKESEQNIAFLEGIITELRAGKIQALVVGYAGRHTQFLLSGDMVVVHNLVRHINFKVETQMFGGLPASVEGLTSQ